MSRSDIPKAMRWQTLVVTAVVAAIAVFVGLVFAAPLQSGLDAAGHWLGFGHNHEVDAVTDADGNVQYYTCGMHPWVILSEPGDCPICHMELTPIDPDKFTGEIVIDPVVVQNMGVRIAPVVTGPLTKTIRTVGTVDYNEQAVRDVNTKVSGWIEKLDVDFVGEKVQAGDPLFGLYSPQLYAAQEEYLLTWRNRNQTPDARNLLDAARTRLEYFDIADKQIEQLQKTGEPAKAMTIDSPYTGVVIAKHANEGMKIDPGMQLFRIADLSKVWVLVTLYEYQLPYVKEGMQATMTLPYIPGQVFEGSVIYVYPYLQEKTREAQVRLEFDNPHGTLKPGMFANVTLENTLASTKTLAPRSSIIDTGERQVAFVSLGEGKFEPRNVRMGVQTGDGLVEIIDGLKPGEMVVTSGQFLIDSESKMREALAKMITGDLAADQKVSAEIAGQASVDALPDAVVKQINATLQHYLAIGDALANDTTDGISGQAEQLATALDALVRTEVPGEPQLWQQQQDAIATARSSAFQLVDATDLAEARLQFADLSTSLESLLMVTGVPPSFDAEVQVLHCPMYRAGQGGTIWLQKAGAVRNPYFGATMLECFDQRKALPVTGEESVKPASNDAAHSDASDRPNEDAPHIAVDSQQRIDGIVQNYLAIQQMLTKDQWQGASAKLAAIRKDAEQLTDSANATLAALSSPIVEQAATKADDIDTFRDNFFGLSKAVLALVHDFPPTAAATKGLYHAYCPMVKKDWLQPTDAIRNPYAPAMLECGSIKQQITLAPKIHADGQQQETE